MNDAVMAKIDALSEALDVVSAEVKALREDPVSANEVVAEVAQTVVDEPAVDDVAAEESSDVDADAQPDETTVDDDTPGSESESLTVEIDRDTFAELQELAAYGREAMERDKVAARAAKVDAAIKANKISASARDRWITAMDADEADASARLAQIPADTIPRLANEIGHGRADFDAAATTTPIAGIFPAPTV